VPNYKKDLLTEVLFLYGHLQTNIDISKKSNIINHMNVFKGQANIAREQAPQEELARSRTEYDAAHARLSGAIGFLGTGHLDTTACRGNAADRIVVPAEEGDWHVPLDGVIDVVDRVDGEYISKSLAHVSLDRRYDGEFALEVAWTGTDDEVRRAEVDLRGGHFVPHD
jgi:hypothetical protein